MNARQPPPRHLLLIATQSDGAENELNGLEAAADGLHAVLTDPAIGGCTDSPGLDAAQLRSGRVLRAEVDSAVRSAVAAAGRARATLVLAFLGHGQVSAGSRLWYLAADSKDGQSLDCVDLAQLVALAAGHPGLAGVVVLIDTCHAAAGIPDTGSLIGGFRVGASKVAVLAACAAHERAFGLSLSRRLAALLAEGLPGEGEFLPVGTLAPLVRDATDRQLAADFAYNGTGGVLWLARNRRHDRAPAGRAGTLGAETLAAALRRWPAAPPGPPPHTRDGLTALAEQAESAQAWGVQEAADGILAAMDAAAVLTELAGASLTTAQLRSLVAEFNRQWLGLRPGPVQPPEGLGDRALLQYLLEDAVLRVPVGASRHGALAWYLVAAAHACGRDPQDRLIRDWAREADAEIALNDAAKQYAAHRARDTERRLVVSLDAAQVDWPDSLSVCVRDGAVCVDHRHFPCPPDQAGVERTLPEVLDWAESLPSAAGPIDAVDLVVHTPVLLDWHPEEALAGMHLLGVEHTAALRWAGRLVEPRHFRGMNRKARLQLEQLRCAPWGQGPPVDRVDPAETVLDTLPADLARGRYRPAVLLTGRPAPTALRALVEAFLPYAPIVLWPRADTPPEPADWDCLAHLWDGLPAGFGAAYRRVLTGREPLPPVDPVTDAHLIRLADLRTAWHDADWLDFCAGYHRHGPAVPAPAVAVPAAAPAPAGPAAVPAPRST
ncbi:hypothetical protein [Kitasatospora cheerisanensis]|uniref:vWA-MoxR associated protein middle region 2 domain-containing protein n=1 Tax=Kitasatospora cheerisanensis KCTC 2395 TaxID=1348663 RepID=A0A066YHM0_9ACTN|nr:hypothetical protein [Kitasatospora cheerisanensis]KDN80998.1 hypothetical protein KCH_70920 [Kitasatospora cheerisanensis KCTC 2395]